MVLSGQHPVDFRQPYRQFTYLIHKDIIYLAVHVSYVVVGLFVNGNTKGMDTGGFGLDQGVTGVLNGVLSLVIIIILRLTV